LTARSAQSSIPASPQGEVEGVLDSRKVHELVTAHFDFVWRSLRRLGVPAATVDDAAQQVFLIASRKMLDVPYAAQRSFLFGVALRVAAEERRARKRRPEDATGDSHLSIEDPAPGPEELLDRGRARSIIDNILEAMPLEMRTVFILFEVEELRMSEISALLELPPGTVASRLRRARELFQLAVGRLKARPEYRVSP
jgi:RNA polymerase sigma-70 factor (ECF subfamily)